MKVTYYGHSCILVETCGAKLLFDPFISGNPATTGVVDLESLSADYILLSHGHADHVGDAQVIQKRCGSKLISNFEIISWYQTRGIKNTHPMNHGGRFSFPFGQVHYVSAIHSSVLPDGSYGGNPGGFVVQTAEGTFYFSGDTALTYDMKLIGEDYTVDWAALCIGDNFTMGPKDAAKCAGWIGTKEVVGIHYDTFPPIVINHAQAVEDFTKVGVKLHLPGIGKSLWIEAQK